MRKILLLFMLLANLFASAQIEMKKVNAEETIERLFQLKKETIPTIACNMTDDELNSFSNKKKEYRGTSPFCVGKALDVSYSLADGIWTDVKGGHIWRLSFSSEDAKFISFFFSKITLPHGAWLYITNKEGDMMFGPVTSREVPKCSLLTGELEGDMSTIYLFEPEESRGTASLHINKLIHGFENEKEDGSRSINTLVSNDVACYPEYAFMSEAICNITYSYGGIYYSGSGALVMTADNSFKSYCLMAFHSIDIAENGELSSSEISAIEAATFHFGYKRDTCNGSVELGRYYTGATLKAYRKESDFALIELDADLKEEPERYWLGWDNSNNTPQSGTCLHHPQNHEQKIALDDDPLATQSYEGFSNNCWKTDWEEGYTVVGSSGAPLLNEQGHVVGQLWGVPDSINHPTIAAFGKLSVSWNGGVDSTQRLKEWLDPQGTNMVAKNGSRYMDLMGPHAICNSGVYEITNLANGMSVLWDLSDSYYSNSSTLFKTDYPANGKCFIKRDKNHALNGTLTAYLYKNEILRKTFSISVMTVSEFECTIAAIGAPSSYTFPAYLTSGMRVNVPCNSIVTLTSSDFTHMSITKTGNASNYFEVDGSQIHFTIPTTNLGQSITIYGQSQTDCQSFSLTFLASNTPGSWKPKELDPLDPIDFDSLGLNVYPIGDGLLQIEIVEKRGNEETAFATQTKEMGDGQTWQLEVYRASNGSKVYGREIEEAFYLLNTSEWPSGTYIIRVLFRFNEQEDEGKKSSPCMLTAKVKL